MTFHIPVILLHCAPECIVAFIVGPIDLIDLQTELCHDANREGLLKISVCLLVVGL